LLLLSAILLLLGMAVGSTGWDSLALLQRDPSAWQIVWEIRLPRSVGAWLAGGLLGLAGALAQGLFRNPLADPYLLGSASGASLGVALASSGIGLLAMAAAGVELLWTRAKLRRWLVMAPPVVLYVAWYAGFHAPVAKGKGAKTTSIELATGRLSTARMESPTHTPPRAAGPAVVEHFNSMHMRAS
jgi:ABC-type Fe3+-siderophore transport system permease subunit